MANEANVLKSVKQTIKNTDGCAAIRVDNVTGIADVIACVRARFVCIECKYDKHGSYQLSKGQRIALRNFEKAGALCLVVDKDNTIEFEKFCEGDESPEVMMKLDWKDAL